MGIKKQWALAPIYPFGDKEDIPKKERKKDMKRRIISSVLALVMVLSLMIVPSITVSAAEPSITVNVIDGTFEYAEDKLGLLIDGEAAADATAFGDARYVSFKNTSFDHDAVMNGEAERVNGTIEFVYDLGEVKPVAGAYLTMFIDTNSMIGKPAAVHFYGSADGDCWYHISAGGNAKVDGGAELAESVYRTETTDESITGTKTKAIYNLQFVKAVVTVSDGWVFASEIGAFVVDEPKEGSVINPQGPFEYVTTGTGLRVYAPADQPEGGFDLSDAATKNAQVLKLKATDIKGVYDITFNRVNAWPAGQSGIMTLADDELMVAINTGGNLYSGETVDLKSAAKWTARGLTTDAEDDGIGSGDYAVVADGTISFFPAAHPIPAYVAAPARVGEVISVGKTYTTSPLHRQGGKEVGWAYDENAPVSYPDEDGKSLTDGIKVPQDKQDFSAPEFAGFNYGTPNYKELGYSWINLDLGEVTDISKIVLTFGSSMLGSGIGANNLTVRFYVSEDGETWTYLGEQQAVDSTEEITVDVAVATDIAGRYVKAEFSRAGWMFVTELSVYDIAPDPVNLYVNAINDVINYSVSGKFNKLNTVAGTEGYAAIISDPAKFGTSYAWVNMAYFAPTDVAGVYEVIAIQQIAGEATAPLAFPEGGFVYITNTGNDWPALCKAYKEALEADPNTTMEKPWYYDQYKDHPNFQTPEVNASFTAIAGLEAGMKATLVNVNLELSQISDRFQSYILVNDVTDMPYVEGGLELGDIDLTNKEIVKVETDSYTYIDAPDAGWPDNSGNSLIDGVVNQDNNPPGGENPGWKGKTSYFIDFKFKAPADIYAVEIQVRQLMGWGISRGTEVQYYGTTDGENYFYLGTGYISADNIGEDGTVVDGIYPYTLELAKYAKGLTGIRVALGKDGTGWLFADEFAAYTATDAAPETPDTPDAPVEDESQVVVPPTGEMTPFVILGLAFIVVCGAVTVIKKRRA